jgi:hypothetical protein
VCFIIITNDNRRPRWPHGLRRGSAAARLLGVRVRIPSGVWMSVCCQVEVSATGRSLAQRSPIECGVSECDLETSTRRMPRPAKTVQP